MVDSEVGRRGYLGAVGAAFGALAGCSMVADDDSENATTVSDAPTENGTPSSRGAFYVAPDGDDGNDGSEAAPLERVQVALERARPGATIRLAPGRYEQGFETVRAGEPDAPITLTGPADAVITGAPHTYEIFSVNHSHVHLTGLTFDGRKDPNAPEDPEAHAGGAVHLNRGVDEDPIGDVSDVLLRDIVVKPAAIGNFRRDGVNVDFAVDVEVGEFEVIGPMGLDYLLTEESGYNGEIVYVGRSVAKAVETEGVVLDPTSDVHVHHIDNSAGHEHAELVDVKPGTSNVLVEYCTDGGGAGSYEDSPSVGVKGRDITVRWCRIENVASSGVQVASWHVAHPEESPYDVPEEARDEGQTNEIYGNVIRNYPVDPVDYMENEDGSLVEAYGPSAQRRVCGNEYDGEARGNPGKECGSEVPAGDGVGHTGGDSPWT